MANICAFDDVKSKYDAYISDYCIKKIVDPVSIQHK